ncbi:MAG: deaminase/reductase [Acidimicrobiales bacterium]|nr:deaminase/reductase [Acidimicrobiales bacterium]
MATIVMSGPQNTTLDGVIQDPDGQEGWEHGGWFVEHGGDDLLAWSQIALEEANAAAAWLLGRRSYDFFAKRWEPRDGELADRLRTIPKYVVSSTLRDPGWTNTTVLGGDAVKAVTRLKEQLDGEIVIPASHQLGRTLLEHGLVDEVRLVVFPVVLGAGERFFAAGGSVMPMRLTGTRTVGDGLVLLTYQLAGPGSSGPRS